MAAPAEGTVFLPAYLPTQRDSYEADVKRLMRLEGSYALVTGLILLLLWLT
jgi:hypothetical protein